ncbi:MAG TPA: hypothetical protein VIH64_03970 [Streptosporangiaceae bacterium]
MTTSNVSAPPAGREDEEEQHRLSALEGLAALSLDALSSVAYGPEAILIVLNAAVGVSAGVDAVTSAFPGLYGARVWLCLAALALITAANFWGVAESARPFIKQRWAQWGAKVPLVTLYSPHRTLGPPIVSYLRQLEGEDTSRRLVVLIAELEPMRAWQWILHNQRGAVLERAVRHDTTNVVVCRIRFQPTTWSAD